MRHLLFCSATLAILMLACLTINATPISSDDKAPAAPKRILASSLDGESIDLYDTSFSNTEDEKNLLVYEPDAKRKVSYQSSQARAASDDSNNVIMPALNFEREESSRAPGLVTVIERNKQQPSGQVAASLAEEVNSPNADRFGSIAFNSREVRLVGPNQREVEMKDNVATKMVVVLENLQKEAGEVWDQVNEKLDKGWKDIKRSEVWSQVNDKLDKGWTDLRSMVEGVVAPKQRQP